MSEQDFEELVASGLHKGDPLLASSIAAIQWAADQIASLQSDKEKLRQHVAEVDRVLATIADLSITNDSATNKHRLGRAITLATSTPFYMARHRSPYQNRRQRNEP